ncbi:hypothetical protein BsWGS_08424 [Bradybaena similaris]
MDLLLQAARVLELENSDQGADPKSSARGTYIPQNTKSKPAGNDRLDGSQTYSDNGISAGEDDIPLFERTSRRVGGIGTREVHNQLEKNRRKQLREFFNHLQQCVPSLENKRVATQSILQGAIKHIKNLKKKDVEQEREIQMLAKKKSELKKKYDLELNKCTEDQQRMAHMFLSVFRSKVDTVPVEQDGHSSDSTSTASEGPSNDDLSDGEMGPVQPSLRLALSPGSSDGRKRKLLPQIDLGQGIKVSDASTGNLRTGVCTSSLVSSSVSSSSVALKHMLEQRKKNQTATGQANTSKQSTETTSRSPMTPTSSSPGINISTIAAKGSGSLTYSYPIITTHLVSAVKPPVSLASPHNVQSSQLTSQSSLSAVDRVLFSQTLPCASPVLSSQSEATVGTMTPVITGPGARKNRKANQSKTKDDVASFQQTVTALNSSLSSHSVNFITAGTINSSPVHILPDSPLKVTPGPAYLQAVSMIHPQPVIIRTPENRKQATSPIAAQKVATSKSRLDLSNFSHLDKSLVGHTGSVTLASTVQPLNVNMTPSKILPTVIPFSLASIMRGLPVNSGLPQMVTLASSAVGFSSSINSQPTTSHTELASSSILNSKLQITPNANYVLTAMPVTTQQNQLSLSSNSTRIATLLSAPSSHINKSNVTSNNSIMKPNSPSNSTTTTICPSSPITIPVTLTSTLVPLSLNSGQMATNPSSVLSSGTPLHIFTSLSQTPMMATSLTNGQSSLIPTVVQLEASGQVALLQNLIPGQHLHVQNSHHILTQPFVVMATANSNFNASTSAATTTS